MLCPICKQPLIQINQALYCESNHGVLVTGKILSDIEKTTIKEQLPGESANTEHDINCPHCSSKMHKVNYNHTGAFIDSCTNCHYRWLDTGEVDKIKNHKPKVKAEDLLFLDDLAVKTASLNSSNSTDLNPKIPLFNVSRIVSAGNSQRTLVALSGMSFYGIITGMLKSKFLRIIILIMLIFIALFYYLVIKSF